MMGWLGMNVLTIDPGEIGSWITKQNGVTGGHLSHKQVYFEQFIPEKKYDVVACLSVIEHTENDIAFFRKLLDTVADGGILILTTDFHPSGEQIVQGHIRTYNKEKMLNLISIAEKQGFVPFLGMPDYDYFGEHVNGCDFASLVLRKDSYDYTRDTNTQSV